MFAMECRPVENGFVRRIQKRVEPRVEIEQCDLGSNHNCERRRGDEPPCGPDAFGREEDVYYKQDKNDRASAIQPDSDLLREESCFAHCAKNAMPNMNDDACIKSESAHPERDSDQDQI